jgi:dTDP-4-amino-4,6-dideoxygalactose transaminase
MGKISKYEWIDIGSSFVPSEISCAILYAQLEEAITITKQRLDHFHTYQQGLQSLVSMNKLQICHVPNHCENNAHIFFLLLPTLAIRQYYELHLRQRGISAFTHYIPLHSAPAGIRFGRVGSDMTNTKHIEDGLLRLPIWTDLTNDQIHYVIRSVYEIAKEIDELETSKSTS